MDIGTLIDTAFSNQWVLADDYFLFCWIALRRKYSFLLLFALLGNFL